MASSDDPASAYRLTSPPYHRLDGAPTHPRAFAVQGAMTTDTAPLSYTEMMANPQTDPCGRGTAAGDPVPGYASIFSRWTTTGASVPTAAEVGAYMLTDFRLPVGGVGYFVDDDGKSATGVLKVAHGFQTFAGFPTTRKNRNKVFGYVDDVLEGSDMLSTFELDPAQLEVTGETRCARSPEHHAELLAASPTHTEALGVLAEALPPLQMLTTRKAMYIPYGLMEYVLGKDLTGRQAFEILWPVIQSKGWAPHTGPLLEFLMVATTLHDDSLPPRTWNARLGLGDTSAVDVLLERREEVLYRQLPALRPGGPLRGSTGGGGPLGAQGEASVAELAAQMIIMNNHNRAALQAREERQDKAALPKTARDKFGEYMTDKLLHLVDGFAGEDLPRVYHELAARQAGVSKRVILQEAYDVTAKALNLNRLPASPTHVLCLDQWDLTGVSADALGTGLLPFSIVPPDAPSAKGQKMLIEEAERARQYDMSGEAVAGAISVADAKRLYNVGGYVPVLWKEAEIQFRLYAIVLGTLLGVKHAVTTNHVAAIRNYDRHSTSLQTAMDIKYGAALAPALFLFHVQLAYRTWFDERFVNDQHDNPVPDLSTGMRQWVTGLRLGWLPEYSSVPALIALAPRVAVRAAAPLPPGRPPAAANRGPGAAEPRDTPHLAPADRVQNTNRDPRYIGNSPIALNVKSRPVRTAIAAAGDHPPTVVRGGRTIPTCLSWHLRGMCSADCQRLADHVPNTEEEKERLWEWTKLAYS